MRLLSLLLILTAFAIVGNADPRLWGDNGIPIRQGMHLKWNQGMARDASGNTLLIWSEKSSGQRDVRAQLINSAGQAQWVSGGVAIAPDPFFQDCPVVTSVPGGWIVTWADFRDTSDCDAWSYYACAGIFAQKLDYSGNRLWPENDFTGVNVHTGAGDKFSVHSVPDGSGGAFIAWTDYQFVYAQRVTASGDLVWPQAVQISDSDYVLDLRIASGSDGSLLVAWDTYENYIHGVRLSRILPDGSLPWGTSGIAVSTTSSSQARIVPDEAGGCYVAWTSYRDGDSARVSAQHVTSNGQALWAQNGISVSDIGGSNPDLAQSANNGETDGILVIWAQPQSNSITIYAQKVSPEGIPAWQAGGISVAGILQYYWYTYPTVTSDHNGGLVAVWQYEAQDVPAYFAARVRFDGTLAWGSNPVPLGGGAVPLSYYYPALPCVAGDFGNYFIGYVGMDTLDMTSIHYQMLDHANGSRLLGPNGASAAAGISGYAYLDQTAAMSDHRTVILWMDYRDNANQALYYQIIGADGQIQRAVNGVPLTPNLAGSDYLWQNSTQTCEDGTGGLFVCFRDERNSDSRIRASHIHSSGDVSPDSGMIVWMQQGTYQSDHHIAADGENGCYVAWSQEDHNDSTDNYVMRLNSDLQRAWNQPVQLPHSHGNVLCGLVNSGNNCCLTVWENASNTIWVSGICSEGALLWSDTVCAASGSRSNPVSVSDGNGGAYLVWKDTRNGQNDLYAQRVSADGTPYWTANGIPVCNGSGNYPSPQIVLDSGGDLCVFWSNGSEYAGNKYAQRISPDGNLLWDSSGVLINYNTYSTTVVASSRDGIFYSWGYGDIYGTHLDSTGNLADPFWRPDSGGLVAGQAFPHTMSDWPLAASDNWGGCVVSWNEWEDEYEFDGDRRGGEVSTSDIYAQHLFDYPSSAGERETNLPREYTLYQNYPNPFNPVTEIRFDLPKAERVRLQIYNSLGQLVTTLADEKRPAGSYSARWNGDNVATGLYFCRFEAGSFVQTKKMLLLK